MRTLGGDAAAGTEVPQAQTDLVMEYVKDTYGNLRQEKHYGGVAAETIAGQSAPPDPRVPTGSLCSLTLPSPRYEIHHDYTNAVRSSSKYYSGGNPFLTLVDRTIDKTGVVTDERDAASVATHYAFDPADPLRLLSISSDGAATISYSYSNAVEQPFTP